MSTMNDSDSSDAETTSAFSMEAMKLLMIKNENLVRRNEALEKKNELLISELALEKKNRQPMSQEHDKSQVTADTAIKKAEEETSDSEQIVEDMANGFSLQLHTISDIEKKLLSHLEGVETMSKALCEAARCQAWKMFLSQSEKELTEQKEAQHEEVCWAEEGVETVSKALCEAVRCEGWKTLFSQAEEELAKQDEDQHEEVCWAEGIDDDWLLKNAKAIEKKKKKSPKQNGNQKKQLHRRTLHIATTSTASE